MYDMRGLTGDQYSECGAKVDRARVEVSSIPLVHCEGLAAVVFLKTAIFATFKTGYFSTEIAQQINRFK